MKIKILPGGNARCVYTDAINLRALGALEVRRASTVEFDHASQKWRATLTDGTVLGDFDSRTEAIQTEVRILEERL